jgi:hypothetical protein
MSPSVKKPPCVGRRFRIVEIFPDDRCAADVNFPHLSLRDHISLLIAQLDEHSDHGSADRPNLAPLVLRREICHQADFGSAVEFVEAGLGTSSEDRLLGVCQQR